MDAGLGVTLLLLLLLLAPRPAVQNLMAHLPHFFNDPLLGLARLLHVSAGVLDDAQQGLNFGPQLGVLFQSGLPNSAGYGKASRSRKNDRSWYGSPFDQGIHSIYMILKLLSTPQAPNLGESQ